MKQFLFKWLNRLAKVTLWWLFPKFEVEQRYVRIIDPSGVDLGSCMIVDKDLLHVYLRFGAGGFLSVKKWKFARMTRVHLFG